MYNEREGEKGIEVGGQRGRKAAALLYANLNRRRRLSLFAESRDG
jgi:hypothetical protein